jgi:hypothetical protein
VQRLRDLDGQNARTRLANEFSFTNLWPQGSVTTVKYDSDGNLTPVSDRETVRMAWKIGIGVIVAAIVVTIAVWGLGIVTAPWVGRQNAHRTINNPTNQIFQYNHFFQLDADIHADATNLKTQETVLANTSKPQPGDIVSEQTYQELVTNVTGLSAQCEALIAQYNNNAVAYTTATFRSHSLPPQEADICEVTP